MKSRFSLHWKRIMGLSIGWRIYSGLLLGTMGRRQTVRGRRVDAEEFYLVWQSPDFVLKVSNDRFLVMHQLDVPCSQIDSKKVLRKCWQIPFIKGGRSANTSHFSNWHVWLVKLSWSFINCLHLLQTGPFTIHRSTPNRSIRMNSRYSIRLIHQSIMQYDADIVELVSSNMSKCSAYRYGMLRTLSHAFEKLSGQRQRWNFQSDRMRYAVSLRTPICAGIHINHSSPIHTGNNNCTPFVPISPTAPTFVRAAPTVWNFNRHLDDSCFACSKHRNSFNSTTVAEESRVCIVDRWVARVRCSVECSSLVTVNGRLVDCNWLLNLSISSDWSYRGEAGLFSLSRAWGDEVQ